MSAHTSSLQERKRRMAPPQWARRCLRGIPLIAGLLLVVSGAAAGSSSASTTSVLSSSSPPPPYPLSSSRRQDGFDFPAAAEAAVEALMSTYANDTGLWGVPADPWYQSGMALQAVLDYTAATGSRRYLDAALHTVEQQRGPLPWWPEGGGEFRADSTDDTGWWALALTTLHELTADPEWLRVARLDEAYMFAYWNTTTCGGGLIWDIETREYHNAISNELYLALTARLSLLLGGEDGGDYYRNQSRLEWDWFAASGMINAEGLVNDGLTQDAACANNGAPTWTYNQGVLLGGLVDLHAATGDAAYLARARAVADAVLASALLVQDGGILTEPCPAGSADCAVDAPIFKGVFVRYLAKLDRALERLEGQRPYYAFIEANARSAYDVARSRNGSGTGDFYGYMWQAPFDTSSLARQVSAVNLMVAGL
ncbi:hypothetical protein SLS62_009496 [Diatrype stigma]|uniref:Mannan endo-1,6-alpha-mannosidase n=1 Tax=Diatrype stigma TaxID=117547 RepID=A0AAN9YKG1_9PEZI